MTDGIDALEAMVEKLTAENARLHAEVEEVRAALLRYYEMSRTRPESVSTADIARMARKEVEALSIMVDQFLSERDTARADLARVTVENARLHGEVTSLKAGIILQDTPLSMLPSRDSPFISALAPPTMTEPTYANATPPAPLGSTLLEHGKVGGADIPMTDEKAARILRALDEDESRPRYCSDAGAADLHRINAEAIRFALQALTDRAALAADYDSEIGVKMSTMNAARRHMKGEE